MHRTFLIIACVSAMVAVILGAFAAHGLKQTIPTDAMLVFETGVRYQFYHSFALLITGILYKEFPGSWMKYAGWLFIAGIIFFSGSLYALTFVKAAHAEGFKWIGPITPFGGLMFISGWLCLIIALIKSKQSFNSK